ncbi:MAG TPA: DUF1295 domain-containing protein [Thermoplasmatales archaeon]|nr:DUF1295 domain-containing protein [Thermoplasmatales archaeon]
MTEKKGIKVFLEHVPALTVWYKAILTYVYQITVFILAMVFLWWISSTHLLGALMGQFIIAFCAILPFVYITENSEEIRKKYRKKYGKLAYQYLFYKYLVHTLPLGAASLYFPVLLKTDYFLPAIIYLPSSLLTQDIFPFFSAIPIGVFLIVVGALIRRPSGGFDFDIDSYVYLMFPAKSRKVEGGVYKYIRHPRYLGRFFIALGLGVLANNLLALFVASIHSLSYLLLIRVEDKELVKRFGESFKKYQGDVPALIPHLCDINKFLKFIFTYKNH